jgi:Icc-related predicted phosphoesterase
MRVLCVSDQIDPLIYTSSIKERCEDVGLVLSAGDLLPDYHDFILSALGKPLLFVLGNDYTDNPVNPKSDAAYIDKKVSCSAGLIVAGLGGSVKYAAPAKDNQGGNKFSDFEMNIKIFKLLPSLIYNRLFRGRFLDVLLTHAPPRGINDKNEKNDEFNRGFGAFLWFMRIFKPRYLVHGHVHLYDLSETRITKYFDTVVVNAYGHCFINLDAGSGHSLPGNLHPPPGSV